MLAVTVMLAALVGACGRTDGQKAREPKMTPETPHVAVFVSALGIIEVDGNPADLQAVAEAFASMAKQGGVVLYARESPESEPHPNGMKVIELAVQNRLPLRLCKNKDFSDAIGLDGKLKTGE